MCSLSLVVQVVETLQHIVLNNQQDFHDDVPQRFLELVQLCRIASADTLESIWRQVSDKPRYRYLCVQSSKELYFFEN